MASKASFQSSTQTFKNIISIKHQGGKWYLFYFKPNFPSKNAKPQTAETNALLYEGISANIHAKQGSCNGSASCPMHAEDGKGIKTPLLKFGSR